MTRRPRPPVNHAGAIADTLLPAWLNLIVAGCLLVMAFGLGSASLSGPGQLRYPAETAGRIGDRHWYFYEAYDDTHGLSRAWHRLLFGTREQVERGNIDRLQEVLAYFESNPAAATPWAELNARARLLVGLAESGRWSDLEAQLSRLGTSQEEETLAGAIRFAYDRRGTIGNRGEVRTGENFMPIGWAADRLALRIAGRDGESGRWHRARARLDAEGKRLRFWSTVLGLVTALLIVSGSWLLIRGDPLRLPGATPRPRWSRSAGLEVLTWSGVAAILTAVALQFTGGSYFRPGLANAWVPLLAGIPMLWMIHRRLLKPAGRRLVEALGLDWHGRLKPLAGAAIALFAAERAGAMLIAWAGSFWGSPSHWAQGINEPLLFGPTQTVLVATVALLVWSPLIEEIAFRGLLFGSLAQHGSALGAALISATLFAALHGYSLTAFATVLWSGLVFSWGYHRSRSLLPGVLAHSIGNALSLVILVVFYR